MRYVIAYTSKAGESKTVIQSGADPAAALGMFLDYEEDRAVDSSFTVRPLGRGVQPERKRMREVAAEIAGVEQTTHTVRTSVLPDGVEKAYRSALEAKS